MTSLMRCIPPKMCIRDSINTTEDRAVLHTALRRPASQKGELIVDGQDVVADVHEVLEACKKMKEMGIRVFAMTKPEAVSYTHLRASAEPPAPCGMRGSWIMRDACGYISRSSPALSLIHI